MIHSLYSIPVFQTEVDIPIDLSVIDKMEYMQNDRNFFSENFYVLNSLNFINLKNQIQEKINYYKEEICGIKKQNFYITNSWIAKTPKNGSHLLHNHPNSILSGVVYLKTPDNSIINFCKDIEIFKDFKFHFDYEKQTSFYTIDYSIPVKSRDIVIFPSWLEHYVPENLSEDERIILGFNCFVEGEFGNDRYPTHLTLIKKRN